MVRPLLRPYAEVVNMVRKAFVAALFALVPVSACGSSSSGSSPLITQDSAAGNWTLAFQWPGRYPGVLKLVNHSDQTCMAPGGQPGDSAQDTYGSWSVNGNTLTWSWSDSTWTGDATSATTVSGTMTNTKGSTGNFNGCEGVDTCPAPGQGGGGGGGGSCHSDSDCGRTQICRSGSCVSVQCKNDAECGNCQRCISNSCQDCGQGPYGCYC